MIVVHQGTALGGPGALQDQDGLVHQLMAHRVGLIQFVEKGLDLGGQQDFPLHTAPFGV